MKRSLVFPLLIMLLVLLGSCDKNDPDALAQKEIRDILYDISLDFNLNNITGIMDHLSDQYLHKGMIAYQFNDLWLDRMAQFNLLEIEVLYIELMDNRAVVHSNNKFTSAYENVTLSEPEDSGDVSYFIRQNGVWLVHGNQLWVRAGSGKVKG